MEKKNYKPQDLFEMKDVSSRDTGPVTCFGMSFENDEVRRDHFTEELRKKLKDPDFRKIEGFPLGEDEDILKLSDPPYYTACPTPWVSDFVEEWENQKPENSANYQYHREPFAADVSEGKNDPIYNAHSYHTKVPYKAIMRYILHYTEPGDIVFDGFCGTGMTGVAAQMCGDREIVTALGYQVKLDGTISQEEIDEGGKKVWRPFAKLGIRNSVLGDLSPVASLIASNFNNAVDLPTFNAKRMEIISSVEKECGWMYKTTHSDGSEGRINYMVWSEVFVCPNCSRDIVFWDSALDHQNGCVSNDIECSNCGTTTTKKSVERTKESRFDPATGLVLTETKQVPVLINYSVVSGAYAGKRFDKRPDASDVELVREIDKIDISNWYPAGLMLDKGERWGDTWRAGVHSGITHVHQFYTKRNLLVLSLLRKLCTGKFRNQLMFSFTSTHQFVNKLCRLNISNYFSGKGGKVDKPLDGTLYAPSISLELNVIDKWTLRSKLEKSLRKAKTGHSVVSCCSANNTFVASNSFDYIFVDPPFGGNLMYSELNYLWESWLKITTNQGPEAIQSDSQGKSTDEYRSLIVGCFKEFYRILKPGRWLTIEFSNTKAIIWNSLQTALQEAGFVVANVSALDKKKGSFKAVTNTTSVKQDLVISAYKPNGGFEERFKQEAQTEEGVWDFVRTHLRYLPVVKKQGYDILNIPERDPRILFDQVIAYYVRKGYNVPIDSQEFQLGLSQRFSERDGMYFLPEQVAEYDRTKMIGGGRPLQQSLFISNESTAIEWLRSLLRDKPQSYQDINPQFMKELGGWSKNEVGLELAILLEQNFLSYDGKGQVPEQIHSYLSTNWKDMRNLSKDDLALMTKAKNRWYVPDPTKAGDLEKLRERALLKEFEGYKNAKKKLKVFRLEAVRVGFKSLWQQRSSEAYQTIIQVAEKLPSKILEEDPKLLMWYDQAVTRMGDEL